MTPNSNWKANHSAASTESCSADAVSFTQFERVPVQFRHYVLTPAAQLVAAVTRLGNGATVHSDSNGELISVEYPSGIVFTKRDNFGVVKGGDQQLYVRFGESQWHRWD